MEVKMRDLASIPDEIYLLCMLHNIGAINPERSLTLEEISQWTAMNPSEAERKLTNLMENKYVKIMTDSGSKKYFITIDGIRKVLSIYS